VDRKHLPAPDYARAERGRGEYQKPRTPTEEGMAAIWAEVLQLDQVGVHDDFFELGGHSLLATQVVSRVRQAFQAELPLRALFEAPTVAGLADRVETLLRRREGLTAPAISPAARDRSLPLSFAQQRLWFLDQLEPQNPLYNVPYIVRLRGPMKIEILRKSIEEIVRRHESLRTTFQTVDDQPVQVIAPEIALPFEQIDLSRGAEQERETAARKRAMEEVKKPFRLDTGPLLRALILKLADDDHVLVLNTHHIISDRWSMGVLSQELAALYEAYRVGGGSPLPELSIQYADYAVWQRQWLDGEVLRKQLAYWRKQLEEAPALLQLPTDRPRQAVESFWGGVHRHALHADLVRDLRTMSRRQGVTFFMTLLAAFQTLLSHLSSQNDVVIGTDLANRTQLATEPLIGFFVNILPIRTRLAGTKTFADLLKQVRETALGAFAHQDLPFDKLVEELRPERSLTHNPLVQVLFVMQNTPQPVREFGGLRTEPLGVSSTSRFDLVLFVNDPEGVPHLTWMYNPNLFEAATVGRMAELYEAALRSAAQQPEIAMDALRALLAEAERQRREQEQKGFQQASQRKLKSVKRKAVSQG
jgi:acyl carrier protein